jgi:hypothetical protein
VYDLVDWCRAHDIPMDLEKAIKIIVQVLSNGDEYETELTSQT